MKARLRGLLIFKGCSVKAVQSFLVTRPQLNNRHYGHLWPDDDDRIRIGELSPR